MNIHNQNRSETKVPVEVYDTTTGEMTLVDVPLEIADALGELDRAEAASDKRYQRHTYSLECALYEGSDCGYEDSYFDPTEEDLRATDRDLSAEVAAAWAALTDTQRRRLKLFIANDYNLTAVAKIEGVSVQAVAESIAAARKKFEEILKKST